MKKEKNILQNIFLLPFLLASFQFCFLFVALFYSQLFFEKIVLIISSLIVLGWGACFLINLIRKKNISINLYNIMLLFIFVFFCLNIITQMWGKNYLRIDAIKAFFEGKTFIDTLYHSAIGESILTNGYPSIQQNFPAYISYHCLSHYIIAAISKAFCIPCFVTYNYLFPIIFVPLLVFIIQKIIILGKSYFSSCNQIKIIDYLLLMAVLWGFFTRRKQFELGCNIYSALFNSESCLIATIIILLYFYIIGIGYKNNAKFDIINILILIPLFIPILFYAKLSFGVVFAAGACYYLFRRYFIKDIRWVIMLLYVAIIFICYTVFSKTSDSYISSDPDLAKKVINISLFHFTRTYCRNKFYIILHYLFLFFPIISALFYFKKKIFTNLLTYKNNILLIEICFLLMIFACLPGALLNIQGGSAFYFVFPVYIFSWLIFIVYDVSNIFSNYVICCFSDEGNICAKKPLFTVVIFLIILSTGFNDIQLKNMLFRTLRTRISLVDFRKDIVGKIKGLLLPAGVIYDKEYLLFNQIRGEINNSPKDYCVFLDDDSDFIKKYDDVLNISHPAVYYVRPYLAISAYIGVPVINSIYIKNDYFYRGDGKIYGMYKDINAYSMPPVLCGEKVTKQNMIERAEKINKKNIIIISKDKYEIINLK